MFYRNYFLAALSDADNAAFSAHIREISLPREKVLHEIGDRAETIYFPSSACISVTQIMQNGDAYEVRTIGREGASALLDVLLNVAVETRTFVQVAGAGLTVPAKLFRERLGASTDLQQLTYQHLRADSRQSEISVACNLAHATEGRLAKWLLMTEDRTGGSNFMLTQEYMAVMTGVQRTTVSQVAATFKEDGLIDYRRGSVTIIDRAGLIARACECYPSLEAQFAGLKEQ